MFQRLKKHLDRESAHTGKKVSRKEFVPGLIRQALEEAEREVADHSTDLDALNPAERALMQTLKDHGIRCLDAMAIIGSPEE